MRADQSFGIIPIKKISGKWFTLLVKHLSGYWAFPKGHSKAEEKPIETAIRELKEETNLDVVQVFSHLPLSEHYFFYWQQEKISKKVLYFIAEVSGTVSLQEEELSGYQWLPIELAHQKATFSEAKTLCDQLVKFLDSSMK